MASHLRLLTQQFSRVSLSQSKLVGRQPSAAVGQVLQSARTLASKSKPPKASRAAVVSEETRKAAPKVAASHQEWIKFQNSISVEGFETGQLMGAASTGKKTRGGKAARGKDRMRQALNEKMAERQRLFEAKGGEYPPLRYEDSETERLLAEAYAALPKRDGKRGTRNLKRQSKRWFLVRQIRSKYKYHMANFQERKMEKRKERMAQVRQVLDAAPGIRAADREYQAQVFQRWAATMGLDMGSKDVAIVTGEKQEA